MKRSGSAAAQRVVKVLRKRQNLNKQSKKEAARFRISMIQ
jgi:hypothetical protein